MIYKTKTTYRQRSKEDAYDYRFFPEPDLPPLVLHPLQATLDRLRPTIPELPQPMLRRLLKQHQGCESDDDGNANNGLGVLEVSVLVSEPKAAAFFEELVSATAEAAATATTEAAAAAAAAATTASSTSSSPSSPSSSSSASLPSYAKQCCNWVVNHLYGSLSAREVAPGAYFDGEFGVHRPGGEGPLGGGVGVTAKALAELVVSVEVKKEVNLAGAKKVLDAMLDEAQVDNARRQGVFFGGSSSGSASTTSSSSSLEDAIKKEEEVSGRKSASQWIRELGLRQVNQ
jgi:Asp-tRNA(Asn)/Glu-tRNA(Gln) amidotransferase B subunit